MAFIGRKPTASPLTASDITDGIISNAKLAQDIISAETALGAEPADTDELLVSDAGTLKRMDYSHIKGGGTILKIYTKMFEGGHSLSGTVANGSATAVANYVSPTITPQSSSSKFIIQWTISGGNTDHHFFQLRRDIGGTVTKIGLNSSSLKNSTDFNDWNSFARHNSTNSYPSKTLSFYDAPATASNVFWQLYYEAHGGNFYFGRSAENPTSGAWEQYSSLNSLVIWEVDGSNITNTYEDDY